MNLKLEKLNSEVSGSLKQLHPTPSNSPQLLTVPKIYHGDVVIKTSL
jgi:hypothetical protein